MKLRRSSLVALILYFFVVTTLVAEEFKIVVLGDSITKGVWFVVGRNDSGDGRELIDDRGGVTTGGRPMKSAVDVLAAMRGLPQPTSKSL